MFLLQASQTLATEAVEPAARIVRKRRENHWTNLRAKTTNLVAVDQKIADVSPL